MQNTFKEARIQQHLNWNKGMKTKNTELMSQCILSGHVGTIGLFPIDVYAQIVYDALRDKPSALATRVCYAFLLSCQQSDALSTIDELLAKHTDPEIASKLYTFKGWIQSSIELFPAAVTSFEKALTLDHQNNQACFLLVQTRLSLMQSVKAGDVEYASKTIQLATNYLKCYSEDLLANYNVDPAFLLVVSMTIECWFRRGPRGGVSIDEMIKQMNCLVQVLDHAKVQLDMQWTGVKFQTSEIDTLKEARARVISMLEMVKNRKTLGA